jgi:zinc-ribbon domain
MAGFCRSCGSPLGDGQGFCTKCGAKVGQAPTAPSTPPAQAAPPPVAAAAPPAASVREPAAAASKGSPVVKIILIAVGVLFVFGAIGIAGVFYVGYRVRQKAREMGLSSEHFHNSSTLRGVDGCQWLPADQVSAAIGMPVAHTESSGGDGAGCTYSVAADAAELTMKHIAALNKSQMSQMSKADQEKMQNFGKSILQGSGAPAGNVAEHPGETAVMAFTVDENGAQFQMNLTRGMMNRLGPMASKSVPDLGDEAFDAAGAILMVRKGEKLLRIMYMQCPCGLDEMLPLARTIVARM